MKKILLFLGIFVSSFIHSQTVYLGSNPAVTDYDRSIIITKNRFEADCIVTVTKSTLVSAKNCGYWKISSNPLNSKYKFLLTTPYSNMWYHGLRPLKVYITSSFFPGRGKCKCQIYSK